MMTLSVTMVLMSTVFIFMKHPISMGLTLIFQTIIVSMTMGIMSKTFWYSYILFLIMVGAMLVLFMYMTGVAADEKFEKTSTLSILVVMSSLAWTPSENLSSMIETSSMKSLNNLEFLEKTMYISKYTNQPLSNIYLMMITYLLVSMIAVVSIITTKLGPLRQKF